MHIYDGFRISSLFGAINYIWLILFFVSFVTSSHDWNTDEFPSPKLNPELCGGSTNETDLFVCDPDHILSSSQFSSINKLINQFHDSIRAKCRCLKSCENAPEPAIFLSFAFIKDLQYVKFANQAARRFALKLLNDPAWNFGPCENGLIGFVSLNPPVFWLEGQALVPLCTTLAEIVDKTQHQITAENVEQTVSSVIQEYWEKFRPLKFNFERDLCSAHEERGDIIAIIVGSIIGFVALLGLFIFLRNCTSCFERVKMFSCCHKKRQLDRQHSSESDDLFEI